MSVLALRTLMYSIIFHVSLVEFSHPDPDVSKMYVIFMTTLSELCRETISCWTSYNQGREVFNAGQYNDPDCCISHIRFRLGSK